uniref:Sulfotransferase domain-containing protein n=1 Tax=Odontella aurita TaxID=265563 RepID=A0A6U6IUK7_9STRA|mmetsp:Transcript_53952/g.161474  ORF Transcript_53952/g.161474 Transcript_53952/m.161474 type:complete len:309 (+) Transcript_53952:142-1068(+)
MWLNPEVQKKIEWRDGDILVSVPPKSGTTWSMNIAYQLREGGKGDFEDLYEEIPWIEFVEHPGQTTEEIVEKLDAMPTTKRRIFKTHAGPDGFPYFDPAGQGDGSGSTKDVKYIVVLRNPDEAIGSFYPFLSRHRPEFLELWGIPEKAFTFPDFESFYRDWISANDMDKRIFKFLHEWWPKRNNSNVLFLHYNGMKKDHEGSVKKFSNFLGYDYDPSGAEWKRILEYTSFSWMKRNEQKFECAKLAPVPLLRRGSMLRRGESGLADLDGVTEEISRSIASRGREVLEDEDAFWFLYKGSSPLTQTPDI